MEFWPQIFALLIGVGLTALVLAIRRRNRSAPGVDQTGMRASGGRIEAPFNPLTSMTFEMLVSGDLPSTCIKEKAIDHVAKVIGAHVKDVAHLSAHFHQLISHKDLLVATFSSEVQRKLTDGSLVLMQSHGSSRMLIAVTKRGHKIVEHGTVAKAQFTAARAANLTSLIVSAAHMVSSYDNAMKIRDIDKKIATLIRRQENEMVGRLEAIFELLNESLSMGRPPDQAMLLPLKLQLKELRATWLRNLEGALLDIETPESQSRIKKWFNRTLGQDKKLAKRVESAVSQQEINVHLIRAALFMEQMISIVLGEGDTFDRVTLVPIRAAIDRIAHLMTEKSAYIVNLSGQSPDEVAFQSSLLQQLGNSLAPHIEISNSGKPASVLPTPRPKSIFCDKV